MTIKNKSVFKTTKRDKTKSGQQQWTSLLGQLHISQK